MFLLSLLLFYFTPIMDLDDPAAGSGFLGELSGLRQFPAGLSSLGAGEEQESPRSRILE